MYYLYRTKTKDGKYYLHKSQHKGYAEDHGEIVAECETADQALYKKREILQNNRAEYVNRFDGTSKISIRERKIQKENNGIESQPRKPKVRVMCVETGIIYDSMAECGRAYNLSRQSIQACILRKGAVSSKKHHLVVLEDGLEEA